MSEAWDDDELGFELADEDEDDGEDAVLDLEVGDDWDDDA